MARPAGGNADARLRQAGAGDEGRAAPRAPGPSPPCRCWLWFTGHSRAPPRGAAGAEPHHDGCRRSTFGRPWLGLLTSRGVLVRRSRASVFAFVHAPHMVPSLPPPVEVHRHGGTRAGNFWPLGTCAARPEGSGPTRRAPAPSSRACSITCIGDARLLRAGCRMKPIELELRSSAGKSARTPGQRFSPTATASQCMGLACSSCSSSGSSRRKASSSCPEVLRGE